MKNKNHTQAYSNNFMRLGTDFTLQLLLVEFVLIVLQMLGIFDVNFYLSIELFGVVVSIFAIYFLSRVFWDKKIYFVLGLVFCVLFVGGFVLSFFLEELSSLRQVLLVNSILFLSLFFVKENKEQVRFYWRKEVKFVFEILLVVYLLLLVLNEFFVVDFLNLNYLLGVVIASGILSVVYEDKSKDVEEVAEKKDYFLGIVLGLIGGILIFIKTSELGWLSYVISIISGVLIMLVSFMILEEDEENGVGDGGNEK